MWISELKAEHALPAAQATASANGSAIDMLPYVQAGGNRPVKAVLSIGSVAGTSPTYDCKLQECDTSNGTFTDIEGAAFTRCTSSSANTKQELHVLVHKRYVRAVETIGGTSPVFGRAVVILAQKRQS